MKKVRWGILSTAKIAREKVIPAMQAGSLSEVTAIASRDEQHAKKVAKELNIPTAFGSYEALLADPEVDAVYIPLPNHMHVEWALKAMAAGKHVLCEKPIGLTAAEAIQLQEAAIQHPQLKVMEAFMYRFHPQWIHVQKLVKDGSIGELKTVASFFSYFNTDPNNIRNQKGIGGGGLMDIGCYCISLSRMLFDAEPSRVIAIADMDADLQIDRLVSGLLDFSTGTATFTCSTQLMPYQRVNILGTAGRIEIEIPFNAPPDKPTTTLVFTKTGMEEIVFEAIDQYTIQAEIFSQTILENSEVPTPLTDAVNNMKVIEAVFESAETGQWVKL
ncbi:MAG: Gfo/Idh/MocA family oxidoreductase [Chitinophagaceae bacterium]